MPAILTTIICVFVSFLFGYFGRNKKMGFWGYFFATLLLTPFVGAILLLVSDNKKPDENAQN
jgi:uncharacterized membrane protein YiaA